MHESRVASWVETDKKIEEMRKKYDEESAIRRAEIEVLQKKNEKTIAELSAASKRQRKSIGDLGNKFGRFTESLAKPSLERILEQQFDADYQGWLYHKEMRGVQDLEVDGWAKARNGSGAAYLVEVKSRFKPKHLRQVWRMVERFRQYKTDYRHRSVYPMLAVVEISDRHRELVWDSGVYLIDIAGWCVQDGGGACEFQGEWISWYGRCATGGAASASGPERWPGETYRAVMQPTGPVSPRAGLMCMTSVLHQLGQVYLK